MQQTRNQLKKKARHPCGSGLNPILEKLEETAATISRSYPGTNDRLIICIAVNPYIGGNPN